jgi:hypothetical protein
MRPTVVVVAIALAHHAAADSRATCYLHFQVRTAAEAAPDRPASPLDLTSCTTSCTAQVRFCRSESGGCGHEPPKLFEVRPKRRLEALETTGGPLCSPWSRIVLPASDGGRARLMLRGRASFGRRRRIQRKRLDVHCRRASPAECRTDLLAPDAVYDVTPKSAWGAPIGRVRVDVERGIEISIDYDALSQARLRGGVRGDDSVALSGEDIAEGDILRMVSGVARFEKQDGGVTMAVTFGGERRSPVSYTLFRPTAGTPAALGGRRRFLLEAHATPGAGSVLELDLDLPASGVATSPAGTEHDASGTVIARTEGGQCLVTPAGGIHCLLPYLATTPGGDPPERQFVFFFGTLGSSDLGSGVGQYYVGSPPLVVRSGTWTELGAPSGRQQPVSTASRGLFRVGVTSERSGSRW